MTSIVILIMMITSIRTKLLNNEDIKKFSVAFYCVLNAYIFKLSILLLIFNYNYRFY